MFRHNSGLALQCSLASLLILVMFNSRSHAELIFAFNDTGTIESFTVNEGGMIDIPIYLIQTGSENRLDSLGMIAMGATMSYAQQNAAGIATPIGGSPASHWTDVFSNFIFVDLLGQTVVIEGLVNNPAIPVKATNNAIHLGTMTFMAGAEGNVTSLSLSLSDNTQLANLFYIVDPENPVLFPENDLIFQTASIQTIVAVPEPSSLLLVGTLSVILGFSRRKTRR